MTDSQQKQADLAIARQLAEGAGEIIKAYWGADFKVEHKGVVDLVSEVDLAAEAYLLKNFALLRPHDQVMAEESTEFDQLAQYLSSQAGRVWCIDPLDGTTNFSHGFPHFCVSIALLEQGQPRVAVVHDPIKAFTFYATQGGGAFLNGRKLKVSGETRLSHALLATGFPYDRHTSDHDNLKQTQAFLKQCQGLRRAGAAALDLAYVAAGWLDGYWEYKLKPWDVAAGALLVEEAGGKVSDMKTETHFLKSGELISASSLALHQSMSQMLNALKVEN